MATEREIVRVGLLHPLRAWVEAMECLLATRGEVELVLAHTDQSWVRSAVARADVDLVVIGLEPADGAGPVCAMRAARQQVGVVVLSESEDPRFISDVVRAGARGWLPQTSTLEELLRVVRGVARGESWFPPMHVTLLVDSLLAEQTHGEQSDVLAGLSTREREILGCLAHGITRREIADRLSISPHTVRTHINHVLAKLDVHSTLAAVSIARHLPLPDQGGPRDDTTQGDPTQYLF